MIIDQKNIEHSRQVMRTKKRKLDLVKELIIGLYLDRYFLSLWLFFTDDDLKRRCGLQLICMHIFI